MKTYAATDVPVPIAPALFGASRDSRMLLVAAAIALLWASAKIQIPLWPVPITMQTYVVLVVALSYGMRLGLAAIGVYAVVACSVARRTREFGVRIALGATRASVVRLALLDAMRPVVAGARGGLIAAIAASRAIEALLFGVSALDPIALGGAVAALMFVGVMAAWIPARRASRLDPMTALRRD
jgi:ABC-type antimicrobial peptide transport system permease subunit